MLSGTADLPLHWGRAPEWLYRRMVVLSGEIVKLMVDEGGTREVIKRISDPFWFQAFGSVLGFDWHSSGLTTVTMAALKEALIKQEIGLKIAGGKGKSRIIQNEMGSIASNFNLDPSYFRYNSALSAKVDGTAIQDGYSIYQHWMLISENKEWAVVQQGMNYQSGYARRYHIMGEGNKNMLRDPNNGIAALDPGRYVLNLATDQSADNRKATLELFGSGSGLDSWVSGKPSLHLERFFDKRLLRTINSVSPSSYEELLLTKGMGPVAVRALSLTASLIYGAEPSWKDPAVFSFAHGGKDGIPYPVDRNAYESTIKYLGEIIEGSSIDQDYKKKMLRKLSDNSWIKSASGTLRMF
ncbi:MAG: DUF763 domain-containing protein [Nitrososphaerota archaeon]|nr:DUF763 domain-containing protein [Nitrososphaerota archaeon]MDG6930941.1 DUF763 domain-containing protein [Nitrososphaerota archaeon]MDG6932241.1 DUF763 domain-containing protein [Nitrososphaerota archaeon]MDG6935766.1 DUF763 domain-containing protein [Nitrososphaerota archaeon]MDG6944084.1 DUF763 domain-containing protein [Nitrososphaerota archaeon]